MKLARHIRRLIRGYGYNESILCDPRCLRETLFFHGITPSLNQVKVAIKKHLLFIVGDEANVPVTFSDVLLDMHLAERERNNWYS